MEVNRRQQTRNRRVNEAKNNKNTFNNETKNNRNSNTKGRNKFIKVGRRQPNLTSEDVYPTWEPERWTNDQKVLRTHNCYSYFLNVLNPKGMAGKPQPGLISTGKTAQRIDCPSIREAVLKDNPRCVITWGLEKVNDKCPTKYYKGFMAVADNGSDYHFYRQDADGTWSHKPGGTEPRRTDSNGKTIYNPATAARDYSGIGASNYNIPCSFFCVRANPKVLKLSGDFFNPGKNMPTY